MTHPDLDTGVPNPVLIRQRMRSGVTRTVPPPAQQILNQAGVAAIPVVTDPTSPPVPGPPWTQENAPPPAAIYPAGGYPTPPPPSAGVDPETRGVPRRENIALFYQDIVTRAVLFAEVHVVVPQVGTQIDISGTIYQVNRVRRNVTGNKVHILLGRVTG